MYTQNDIENFLKLVVNPQNDGEIDIDKNLLKQLIIEKVPFRHEVIRLIAELCKKEFHRKEFVELELLSLMKETLESNQIQEKIGSCRAVGNMCYEYEQACELVIEKIGVQTLFDVCRFACQTTESDAEQMRTMSLGALHNIINSNSNVAQRFLEENIFQIFLLYVPFICEPRVALFLFSIGSNLVDQDDHCEKLISSGLLIELGNKIDISTIYEHRTVVLPYLVEIAEEDRVKENLCSSSIFFKLLTLCEEYVDKDQQFIQEVCYLIVVLITTDASIEHLLQSKDFDLFECGVCWLERANLQLKMTGALIITNLTRNDAAARSILTDRRQPDVKLVDQLKYFSRIFDKNFEKMTDEQAKVVHGVLGALRNLAVPTTNRSILAKSEVLDQVIPFIFVKNFSGEISYKATGVIRFLIRDATETAKSILIDDKILQKIVENSEHFHQGLQFESRRVLFLLPIALKTMKIVEGLANNKAFPLITGTLALCDVASNRGIVQNEALIALNIIMTMTNASISEKLHEANFHENFKTFLNEKIEYPELINNILQLIFLMNKQKFLKNDQLKEYKPILENIRINANPNAQKLIDQTITTIENQID